MELTLAVVTYADVHWEKVPQILLYVLGEEVNREIQENTDKKKRGRQSCFTTETITLVIWHNIIPYYLDIRPTSTISLSPWAPSITEVYLIGPCKHLVIKGQTLTQMQGVLLLDSILLPKLCNCRAIVYNAAYSITSC